MHHHARPLPIFVGFLLGLISLLPAFAGEGMWTFDNPPRKQLKELYKFEPSQQWLDHLRLSSVRVGDGGSGSFVSPDGLLITNHHVGRGQLQKMSTRDRDYVKEGFYARTKAEEIKCPDLELNVLVSMDNVTDRVLGAVKPAMSAKEALDARRAVQAAITKEAAEKSGLRCDIVDFYNGSEFWLYQYKKYTDVRLVMAPEMQIAYYGGDPDNFTFPRHDLDMCFFRAYENDQPASTKQFLKFKTTGATDGEMVFVSGHPGSTNRLQTYSETEYQRDISYPTRLKSYARQIDLLQKYATRGPEQARQISTTLFGISNAQKASTGEYEGLCDKALMEKKYQEDKDLRDRVNANPAWKKAYGWAWDTMAAVVARQRNIAASRSFRSVRGRLFSIALQLVQAADELKLPNGERQGPFQEANLDGTKFRLFSPAPIYPELEQVQIADGFAEALEGPAAGDTLLTGTLAGRTPERAAQELVEGTRLADVAVRKQLFEGGEAAIKASDDPLIKLARGLAPLQTAARKAAEKTITGPTAQANEAIGKARFAVYGKNVPPDATFTLRLSYGTVKGYAMNGTQAPARTTLFGLYDRAISFGNKGPWELPKRFADAAPRLDLSTSLDFVSTCDIIGGNSGSPVVDRDGEFVGLIFDGNIESLPGRFLYSENSNRAVAVHPAAIIECLRKVYNANDLADELEGRAKMAD